MKKLMKRLLATALSAAMLLGIGVGVAAAEPLSVQASATKVAIMQGDKQITSYSVKSSELTLSTNSDSKMVLSFKDASSKKRNVSLGAQTTLTIGGTIASLTLDKALSSKSKITVASASTISKLTVHAGCTVTVSGDATVSKITSSNKSATLQNDAGKKLTATSVSAPKANTTVKKPAATTVKKPTSSSSGITLSTKSLNASKGDTLDDLLDQLNENVIARDNNTDYVLGECKWNTSVNREINGDATLPFTFYPDGNDYDPVAGSVKIYADGNTEEVTIAFKGDGTYEVTDGMRLSDLTKLVKNDLYVENDNGDSLKYSFKWDSSTSTKFSERDGGRSYGFTVTPSSGRYEKAEGSITISYRQLN